MFCFFFPFLSSSYRTNSRIQFFVAFIDEWIAVSLVELEAVAKKMERKAPLDIKPFNDLIVEMVTAASGYRSVPEDSQIPPLDNHQT